MRVESADIHQKPYPQITWKTCDYSATRHMFKKNLIAAKRANKWQHVGGFTEWFPFLHGSIFGVHDEAVRLLDMWQCCETSRTESYFRGWFRLQPYLGWCWTIVVTAVVIKTQLKHFVIQEGEKNICLLLRKDGGPQTMSSLSLRLMWIQTTLNTGWLIPTSSAVLSILVMFLFSLNITVILLIFVPIPWPSLFS